MNTQTEQLLPEGVPKHVRCYDNGGETTDRYTVCYTGRYRGTGWFQHVCMSADPFHPQGVGLHGEHPSQIDAPKGWPPAIGRRNHLGKRIAFTELPEDCRKLVLQDYKEIWNLKP